MLPRLLVLLLASGTAYAADAPANLVDGFLVGAPADVALHGAPLEALTADVITAKYPDTTSVLVYKDDRLVYERYFGAGGINLLNDTRAATQTLTALIVGQALSDGALRSADSSAFELLPDLAPFRNDGPLKRGITLMDLLTMSSALDCGDEEKLYPQTTWSRWVVDLPLKADYLRNPSGRGPFSYCTAGAFLLGQVVQRATRQPLDQYFDRRLFRPLGIRERQWARTPGGEFQSAGGLRLRSRDLLKLGVLVMGNGNWRGAQLVPAAWVRRMQTVSNVADEHASYGMLYWQREYDSPCAKINAWYMSGDGGNAIVTVPLKSLAVVVTRTHFAQPDTQRQTTELLQQHVFAALPCVN
jgi:CubicO group peptidase (beta-lactamase class C family)